VNGKIAGLFRMGDCGALSGGGWGQAYVSDAGSGVNPLSGTQGKGTVGRSLIIGGRTRVVIADWKPAGEAETSAAGVQLVKE